MERSAQFGENLPNFLLNPVHPQMSDQFISPGADVTICKNQTCVEVLTWPMPLLTRQVAPAGGTLSKICPLT
jgi:hypothetical protein